MNGEAWPDLKYRAVSRFIDLQVRRFGSGLPEEECSAEAWRAYLEASREYRRVAGCCDFSDFAAFCIRDSLDTMRRRRSERIALESSLSLDDVPDGGREPFGMRYFPTTGDFSPCVVLWEFVRGLGEEKAGPVQAYAGRGDHGRAGPCAGTVLCAAAGIAGRFFRLGNDPAVMYRICTKGLL